MTPAGLSRLLAESRHAPDGLVPVVGTGLNNETVRIEAADPDDDWASLVDGIAHGTGMTAAERAELPQSFLARWERLVIRWAQAHQLEPFQAERQLEKRSSSDCGNVRRPRVSKCCIESSPRQAWPTSSH
jgi:hypothetical protein